MKRSAGSRAPPAAAHIKALPSAGALRAGQPQRGRCWASAGGAGLRRGERSGRAYGAGDDRNQRLAEPWRLPSALLRGGVIKAAAGRAAGVPGRQGAPRWGTCGAAPRPDPPAWALRWELPAGSSSSAQSASGLRHRACIKLIPSL